MGIINITRKSILVIKGFFNSSDSLTDAQIIRGEKRKSAVVFPEDHIDRRTRRPCRYAGTDTIACSPVKIAVIHIISDIENMAVLSVSLRSTVIAGCDVIFSEDPSLIDDTVLEFCVAFVVELFHSGKVRHDDDGFADIDGNCARTGINVVDAVFCLLVSVCLKRNAVDVLTVLYQFESAVISTLGDKAVLFEVVDQREPDV